MVTITRPAPSASSRSAHLLGRPPGERDRQALLGQARPARRTRYAIRWVSVRVLPVPGPATTSSGPPGADAATRCIASSRPSSPVPTSSMPAQHRLERLVRRRRSAGELAAARLRPARRVAGRRRRGRGARGRLRRGGAAAAGSVEQRVRRRRPQVGELLRLEEPDHAVLAVVAGRTHLAAAQPADRLARSQLAAGPADLVQRHVLQDLQLRPERGDQPAHLGLAPSSTAARRRGSRRRSRQLHEAGDHGGAPAGGTPGRPVGQLLDPVQHADGQRLAARRAAPAVRPGLAPAPVAPRSRGARPRGTCPPPGRTPACRPARRRSRSAVADREVRQLGVEDRRLPGQRRRRVRVRVGHQPVAVQADTRQFIAGSEDSPVSTAKMCSARSA